MSNELIDVESDEESINEEGSTNTVIEVEELGKYIGSRNSKLQRHGNGWALLPNQDQYEGHYKNGFRCGKGLYIFKNGARYSGDWVKGLKHGFGKFIYPDGSFYEGEWSKDHRHGHGIYKYSNGDVYEGAWNLSVKHGLGSYCFKNGESKFIGTWMDGVRIGPAEVVYKKFRFNGNWNNGFKGPGVFTFGCKYMASGDYIEKEESDSDTDSIKSADSLEKVGIKEVKMNVPIWKTKEILKYDRSKLPEKPMPFPKAQSEDMLSSCEVTPYNSDDELMAFDVDPAAEMEEDEGEIENENEEIVNQSKDSLDENKI